MLHLMINFASYSHKASKSTVFYSSNDGTELANVCNWQLV